MTQAFHLLPPRMCFRIPAEHMTQSFDLITREELRGRRVIALGEAAAAACRRNKLTPDRTVCHPSARGWTVEARATKLAEAIAAVSVDAAPAPADSRMEQARRFQREARNTGIDSSELLRQFRDERALRCRK